MKIEEFVGSKLFDISNIFLDVFSQARATIAKINKEWTTSN